MKVYLSIILLAALSTSSHAGKFDEQLELAEQRQVNAQFALGTMYHFGQGVQQDDKTAVIWHTKAAEQGYAYAQGYLGNMYQFGQGVQQDYKTAVMWFTKAAEQGQASAQANLGIMYASGEGVPESDIKAYVWASMAKANGHEMAKESIDILKKRMTKEQIAKAQELAAKCYASDYKDCQ